MIPITTGTTYEILNIPNSKFGKQAISMGLIPKTKFTVIGSDPFRSIDIIHVRGYDLALRKSDLNTLDIHKFEG